MSDAGLLLTFCREFFSTHQQPRGLTPTKALSADSIIDAMRGGGAADGRFAAGYLFHTANISQTILGAKNCLDIGAAPGCQLLQLARLHPEIEFIGVDLSEPLILEAQQQTEALALDNVRWIKSDARTLSEIASGSIDAVISTMTLHDLEDLESVDRCFSTIARVLNAQGAVYLEDYGRLKSAKSTAYFNAVNAAIENDKFALLNAQSMHAAFEISELKPLFLKYFPSATLFSTFLIPFLNVLKTESHQLPDEKKAIIKEMREALPLNQRRDLDDLRKFFKLGGWRSDPFA